MSGPLAPAPPPIALFATDRPAQLLAFREPERRLVALEAEEVAPALRAADEALAAGRHVAGYLSYEAGAAFGLRVPDVAKDGPPLLWLGVFGPPEEIELPWTVPGGPAPAAALAPRLTAWAHAAAVARIQELIAAGDTYQVNFTFPLEGKLREDPYALFVRLLTVQPARHAAFIDLGRFVLASASPELFFDREGTLLRARPMKGTASRGLDLEDDTGAAAALRTSAKDRAENLMIVDMLRNDLGRVGETGTVEVPALFEIERYPTLLQMTSTVTARSRAPLSRVFEALFPCASVTGAPKVRTMQIIAELEGGPRGAYTGTIGWAGRDRARWSVAIRTALADRERGLLTYGVGSGIVADSRAEAEYAECLLKARILEETPFCLLETLAFLPGEGYRRLEGHLARLRRSALYFGTHVDDAPQRALRDLAGSLLQPSRVRLLLDLHGRVQVECAPLLAPGPGPIRVGLASSRVSRLDRWLRHKTTRRGPYEDALRSRPDCDDVLLANEQGEITESSISNVAVPGPGGTLLTPSVESGLLPGVEREALLAEGRVREGIVRLADLERGQRLVLFNSVRGMFEATFVG
jgi:para-aminobenzoate synthetase/4-amino-4-deoxychorismate lyase